LKINWKIIKLSNSQEEIFQNKNNKDIEIFSKKKNYIFKRRIESFFSKLVYENNIPLNQVGNVTLKFFEYFEKKLNIHVQLKPPQIPSKETIKSFCFEQEIKKNFANLYEMIIKIQLELIVLKETLKVKSKYNDINS
jgi:hypothetical protein